MIKRLGENVLLFFGHYLKLNKSLLNDSFMGEFILPVDDKLLTVKTRVVCSAKDGSMLVDMSLLTEDGRVVSPNTLTAQFNELTPPTDEDYQKMLTLLTDDARYYLKPQKHFDKELLNIIEEFSVKVNNLSKVVIDHADEEQFHEYLKVHKLLRGSDEFKHDHNWLSYNYREKFGE